MKRPTYVGRGLVATHPIDRKCRVNQSRPYVRKISRVWVVSGGWHRGMTGFPTWDEALAEVARVAKIYGGTVR